MVSPNYREEAEKIVAEERANGEKMPVYEVSIYLVMADSRDSRASLW
jgi:hypothetical protein